MHRWHHRRWDGGRLEVQIEYLALQSFGDGGSGGAGSITGSSLTRPTPALTSSLAAKTRDGHMKDIYDTMSTNVFTSTLSMPGSLASVPEKLFWVARHRTLRG
jgi:hypothetical protein